MQNQWLNDEIIYRTLSLFNPDPHGILVVDPCAIRCEGGDGNLKSHTTVTDSENIILVTMNPGRDHFSIAVVDRTKREYTVYDPLHSLQYLRSSKRALDNWLPATLKVATHGWTFKPCEDTLKQDDGINCGLCCIAFAVHYMNKIKTPRCIVPQIWRRSLAAGFLRNSPDEKAVLPPLLPATNAHEPPISEGIPADWKHRLGLSTLQCDRAQSIVRECEAVRDLVEGVISAVDKNKRQPLIAYVESQQSALEFGEHVLSNRQKDNLQTVIDGVQVRIDAADRDVAFAAAMSKCLADDLQVHIQDHTQARLQLTRFKKKVHSSSSLLPYRTLATFISAESSSVFPANPAILLSSHALSPEPQCDMISSRDESTLASCPPSEVNVARAANKTRQYRYGDDRCLRKDRGLLQDLDLMR
nr:hypothetical protein CFP56_64719 [Quercus suber]